MLRKHQPDHVLLRAARADAATGLLDIRRLGEMLSRVRGRIIHKALDRVSPLAVPVMLEIGRETVYGEASEAVMAEAADELDQGGDGMMRIARTCHCCAVRRSRCPAAAQDAPRNFPLDKPYKVISISGFDVQKAGITLTVATEPQSDRCAAPATPAATAGPPASMIREDQIDFIEHRDHQENVRASHA